MKKPIHSYEPKESLFYKETMARVKKTPRVVERQPRVKRPKEKKKSKNKGTFSPKSLGKLIKEGREAIQQAKQARRDAKE